MTIDLIVLENHVTTQRGGQELNLLEICRSLADRGHRITLLYLQSGDLLPQYQEFCDSVIQISAYGFDWRNLGSVLKFAPSILQAVQVPTPDTSVIFCNDYHFSLFAHLLARLKKRPYICYLQLPPLYLNRQREYGLRSVDRFIAVSEQTKQDWIDFGIDANRIEVIYNGIDADQFKPTADLNASREAWQIPSDAKVVSYIGRIDREKGLDSLIQAIALLRSHNIHTLIAGKSLASGAEYERSLVQLVEELGVGDRVKFVGHLTDPVSLYQASDVNVLPSIWNEPCSRGLFESLSCGVPKVASRIGGNPEVLSGEFDQYLFTPNDAQDLADRLAQTVDWRDRDPDLGMRCRQHALNHFSRKSMIDRIENTLISAL